MSKKTDLINIFNTYNTKHEDILSKIDSINNNIELTDVGAEKRINDIIVAFQPVATQYHDKAISIIDDGLNSLEDKWKANTAGRLSDSNYQIGLANTIKMIESGAITNQEDFKNIIDVYKDDYNALATIRNLITSSDFKYISLAMLIPKDDREYNKKLLNDLRNNVDVNINPYTINNQISMSLQSMAEFIQNRLGDNLEVIPW